MKEIIQLVLLLIIVYLKGEYKLDQVYTCVISKVLHHQVYASITSCLNEEIGV